MCLLTHKVFRPFDPDYGFCPALAHIIPHSVHGKVWVELLGLPLFSYLTYFSPTL